jgi:3D (Asp-Asp-Asp) domain-containing protein
MIYQRVLLLFFIIALFTSCVNEDKPAHVIPEYNSWKKMTVKASAYNSLNNQTKGNPVIAAWGDSLKVGMKAIAVSRDLIAQGLTHNTRVKIEGFDGYYLVKDKMNDRWKNKIDIYMGTDVKKARKWGRKKVIIYVDTLEVSE